MSDMTAHATKHAFFRDTKGTVLRQLTRARKFHHCNRFTNPDQENRLCGRSQKNMVTGKTLTASANATAPRSSILLQPRFTTVSVALAFLVVAAKCRVLNTRKVALPAKSCMLTERVKRRALPWWRIKLGTLNAETATSQDLCQPLSCCVIPAKMCRTAPRRFLSMS